MKQTIFWLIDVDYYRSGTTDGSHAIIRLYCRLAEHPQQFFIIEVEDFFPYFYVRKKGEYSREDLVIQLKKYQSIEMWLLSIEKEEKRLYIGNKPVTVWKLTGKSPWKVPELRELLKKHFIVEEADIPFVKRFLINTGLRCLNLAYISGDLEEIGKENDFNVYKCSYRQILPYRETTSRVQNQVPLRFLAFDIEVDDSGLSFQELQLKKERPITAISICYGTNEENFMTEVFFMEDTSPFSERSVIMKFLRRLKEINPDVIITFNGNQFDLPYLLSRMEYHEIPIFYFRRSRTSTLHYDDVIRNFRGGGWTFVDLVNFTRRIHPPDGKKTLNSVAKLVLGKEKVDVPERIGVLWKLGLKNPQSMKIFQEYALKDALLTYKLFWGLGIDIWLLSLSLTGYPPGDGIATTERNNGEFELMRILFKKNILIPSLPDENEVQRRHELKKKYPHHGGYVFSPTHDLCQHVIIADFRSMYPTLIVGHNIGGESFTLENVEIFDALSRDPRELFAKKPKTSLAELQENLLNARNDVKNAIRKLQHNGSDKMDQYQEELRRLDRLQRALKIIANSLYGSHNYPKGRFYHHVIANAITDIGRRYINDISEYIRSHKRIKAEVIYGDTDSVFIWLKDVKKIILSAGEEHKKNLLKENNSQQQMTLSQIKHFLQEINAILPSPMMLELEDIAYRIIFKKGRKKAYAYLSMFSDRIIIKGFESVRKDWSFWAKKTQKEVLNLILRYGDAGRKRVKQNVLEIGKELLSLTENPRDERWIILGPLKRDPLKYKSKTPAIGAFLHYCSTNHLNPSETWTQFDRFPYVITKDLPVDLPIYRRARHPSLAKSIDADFYLNEMLNAINRFGIYLSLSEIKSQWKNKKLGYWLD